MINFHKYGFLDCKRLIKLISEKGYFLFEYNPIYLFVNSNTIKPEISFTNEFIYIRYFNSEIGFIYLPPMGSGNLKMAFIELEETAKEAGHDFFLGPVPEDMQALVKSLGYKLIDDSMKAPYVASINNFLADGKYTKKMSSVMKKFDVNHKKTDLRYKIINKEDFPQVLEFIGSYRDKKEVLTSTKYFETLNMVKECFDHLYEFDMVGIALMDQNGIYGVMIGSIIDNKSFIHLDLASDEVGAYQTLVEAYSKYLATKVRYLVFDVPKTQNKENMKKFEDLMAEKMCTYSATFSI